MSTRRALLHAIDPVRWARDVLSFDAEPWQQSVLRSPSKRLLLNCARQSGKSTIAAIAGPHRAIHRPGALVILVAPSLRQSGELFRKCDTFLGKLSPAPQRVEDSATTIALANGSRVVCVPATEATSRGYSAPDLIVLDEASRITDEVIAALRPMLSGGGAMWQLSTPAGQRGHFYESATTHADDWEQHVVRADQIARIDAEFLQAERRALGPRAFAQEYCCEFESTDAALFDLDTIRACLDPSVQPLFGPSGAVAQAAHLGTLLNNMQPLTVN